MHTIKNDHLGISVRQTGAELCRIFSTTTGKEFMWDGNPAVWGSFAPVLFPIVGELKERTYYYQDRHYSLPRHGIVRDNTKVQLTGKTDDRLSFTLSYDQESLEVYPFRFALTISFILNENEITVHHKVTNLGDDEMLFSIGAHPAFCCPRNPEESYEDYYLEFEQKETASRWLINELGLQTGVTEPVLTDSNVLNLAHELFSRDALIFKNTKSKSVKLKSRKSKEVISFSYNEFPYLGIWAKPEGDYVCVEPWLGIADSQDSDQVLENKEGILRLKGGGTFEVSYQIMVSEQG